MDITYPLSTNMPMVPSLFCFNKVCVLAYQLVIIARDQQQGLIYYQIYNFNKKEMDRIGYYGKNSLQYEYNGAYYYTNTNG